MKNIIALTGGIFFGFGLALSGMTDTAKVQGFLDIFGRWEPALMFVMAGAVATTVAGFRWVLRRRQPLLEKQFFMPSNRTIDPTLVVGAGIFGLGWGLYGYCPGPAISALAYADGNTFIFVVAMVLGMFVGARIPRAIESLRPTKA